VNLWWVTIEPSLYVTFDQYCLEQHDELFSLVSPTMFKSAAVHSRTCATLLCLALGFYIRPGALDPFSAVAAVEEVTGPLSARSADCGRHVVDVAVAALPSLVSLNKVYWRRLQFAFTFAPCDVGLNVCFFSSSHRFRVFPRDDFVYPWHTSAMARHYGGCVCAHTW